MTEPVTIREKPTRALPCLFVESHATGATRETIRGIVYAYLIGSLAMLAVIGAFYEFNILFRLNALIPAMGLGALWMIGALVLRRRFPARKALTIAMGAWAIGVFAFTMVYLLFGFMGPIGYGDHFAAVKYLEKGIIVDRWLVGSALWNWTYAAIWKFPLLLRVLPARLATADACLCVTNAVAMLIAAAVLLRRWGQRMSILLPMLCPIWLLFGAGYVEYYPMIAGLLLGFLLYVFELPGGLAARSPWSVGVTVALLPLAYLAYAPMAALLLLFYALLRPREIDKTLGIAVATGAALLACCYPKPIAEFFPELYKGMHWTNEYTVPQYWDHYLFPGSNYFEPGFALSPLHLSHQFFMYFFAGGLAFPILLAGFACLARPRTRREGVALLRNPQFLFAAALLGWEAVYFLFYIARLGPWQDIDLFFATYLIVAYFAGYLLDRLIEQGRLQEDASLQAAAACVGVSCICLAYFLWLGLPSPG